MMPDLAGYPYLAEDPNYCGGAPRVVQAGVRVVTIWRLYRSGVSADEISKNYESLPLGAVFSALAYAADHLDEIRAYIDEEERFTAELTKDHVSHPKLQAAREQTDVLYGR